MRTTSKTMIISSTLAVLLLLPPATTRAEMADGTNNESLTEIVVTAQRLSQSILSIPVAVSALSGETMRKEGITTATSLSSIVPNLQVNDPTGGTEPNFTLRGVGVGNEYDDNQASPIGVYVDDAYLAFRATHGAQLFDLDRVEVLRGPQGTLYGRNTTGGAINFITRGPELSGNNGYLEIGYGNFNDERVLGAVEVTPVDGTFGVRFAFDYDAHDGYIRNVFPNQPDLASANTLSGRVEFRFRPSEGFDATLKLFTEHGEQTQPGVYAIGAGVGGVNPLSGYSRGTLDFFTVSSDTVHHNSTHQVGEELTAKFRLSETLSIQTLTSYDRARSLLGQDVDGSPINVLQTVFQSAYKEFSQELRLVYSSERSNLQAGAYYGWDNIEVANFYDIAGFLQQLGVPADPTFAAGGGTITQHYNQTRISKAVFGQGDYKLADQLTATVGLRYTEDNAAYRDGTAFIGDYTYDPTVQTVGAPGNPLSKTGKDDALTGRAALNYTFDGGDIIYASYGHGYRSGTFNGSGYLSPTQVSFVAPETVNAYEIGAKGRMFDARASFAAAAFFYDYKNQQILDVIGPVGFLRNAGASTVKGLELESTARVAEPLSVTASIGLLSSRYDNLTLQGIDLSGNRLPFAPSITANAHLDWTVSSHVAGGALTVTPSVTYTSRIYYTPYDSLNGNGPLQEGGYALTDATVEWVRQGWSVRLWGKNLADKPYVVYGLNLVGIAGTYYFNQGAPRTFGVSIRKTF